MKLSELKEHFTKGGSAHFKLPNGEAVPQHFHVTELGEVSKHYIDCGGKIRHERKASLQLWTAADTDHRLAAKGFLAIISKAEQELGLGDLEVTVEYQGETTLETFKLERTRGGDLALVPLKTACLALDACGIVAAPVQKMVSLIQDAGSSCCTPGGGCC